MSTATKRLDQANRACEEHDAGIQLMETKLRELRRDVALSPTDDGVKAVEAAESELAIRRGLRDDARTLRNEALNDVQAEQRAAHAVKATDLIVSLSRPSVHRRLEPIATRFVEAIVLASARLNELAAAVDDVDRTAATAAEHVRAAERKDLVVPALPRAYLMALITHAVGGAAGVRADLRNWLHAFANPQTRAQYVAQLLAEGHVMRDGISEEDWAHELVTGEPRRRDEQPQAAE